MSLARKILDYTKKRKELYLPLLWKEWGVQPEVFTKSLCDVWDIFDNPRIKDNLLVLNATDEPDYYEVCDGYNRGDYVTKENLWKHCATNQEENQHISVFSHDEKWIKNYEKRGSVSCSNTMVGMDYVYLELDRESLKKAVLDGIKFYENFPYKEYTTLWYSGNNSIHIEIDASLFGKPIGKQHNVTGRGYLAYNLAHKLAGDLRHENGIVDPWIKKKEEIEELWVELYDEDVEDKSIHSMKQHLENIDPNFYTTNSLIRQPLSMHEKGGKRKIEIPVDKIIFGMNPKPKKEFDIDQKNSYITSTRKPHLIHWFFECNEPKKQKSHYIPDVDEDEIIKTFSQAFKYFDPKNADRDGWVNKLFNPFYNDTNPSVSVNIDTGYVQDFGSPEHCYNFKQFKEELNKHD